MDYTKEYEDLVSAMGNLSTETMGLYSSIIPLDGFIDETFETLYESKAYNDRKDILFKAEEFARQRLKNFGEILQDQNRPLDVEKSNRSTDTLNMYTRNINDISHFMDHSYGKEIFKKFERQIILECINSYKIKLNCIYNILFDLKKQYKNLILPNNL